MSSTALVYRLTGLRYKSGRVWTMMGEARNLVGTQGPCASSHLMLISYTLAATRSITAPRCGRGARLSENPYWTELT